MTIFFGVEISVFFGIQKLIFLDGFVVVWPMFWGVLGSGDFMTQEWFWFGMEMGVCVCACLCVWYVVSVCAH